METAAGGPKAMSFKEVVARAKKFTEVSEEMDKRLQRIASQTWDIIGGDILVCVGKSSIPRADVIECICDADYMWIHNNDHEAYAYYIYLRDNHEKHLAKVMKAAFTFSRYGY